MPISKEEFAELRASGLSVRQIAALDEENARAMIRGYQRGADAVRAIPGSAEGRVAPPPADTTAVATTEGWTPEQVQEGGVVGNLLGLLPAAGGTLGGILGGAGGTAFGLGFGGIPGAIGGSAIGSAGGEMARQHLARALGMDAPESGVEAAGDIGLQGGLGLAGGGVAGVLGKGGQLLARNPLVARILARGAARATGIPGAGEAADMALSRVVGSAPVPGVPRPSMPPGATAVPSPGGFSSGGFSAPTVVGEVAKQAGSAASRVSGNPASEAARALAKRRWAQAGKPKPKGKPDLKVVEKPRAGSAESRVSAPQRAKRLKQRQKDNRRHPQMQQQPQIQVGSDLEARLAQAVKVEQHMNKLGFTDAEKMLVRQQLMNQ